MVPKVQFIIEVFKRDFKGQYRESLGGYLWAILPACASILTFIVAEQSNLINYKNDSLPYIIFSAGGVILWQAFADGISLSATTLDRNRAIVTQIQFPHYVLFTSKIIEGLIYHSLRILIFAGILVYIGNLNPSGLISVVYFGIGMLFIGHAVGALLSPFCLITQDISRVIPFALQFCIWATPVFLNAPDGSMLAKVHKLNPLSVFFEASRYPFQHGVIEYSAVYLWPLIILPILYVVYSVLSALIPIVNERAS